MSDQADGLRQLVRTRAVRNPVAAVDRAATDRTASRVKARSLVLTSGKGGVGTSNVALNLAIALGERGERVVLVDADLGLANLDLLCGLAPSGDLGGVLAEGRPLAEAIVDGPTGVRIIPGAHASRTLVETLGDAPGRLLEELEGLEADADFVIVDAGTGLGPSVAALADSSDEVVVVTTPEPPSIADAHASIRLLARLAGRPSLGAVVCQARTSGEGAEVLLGIGATSRQFLGAVVHGLGTIRADPHVPLAVRSRRPFATAYPSAPASRDVRRLARALATRDEDVPRVGRLGFFAGLADRWTASRVGR